MRIFAVGKLPTPTPTLTPSPHPWSGRLLAKACRLSGSHSHLSPRGCPGTGPTVPSQMPLDTGASRFPRMGTLQGAEVGWCRVGRSIVWAAPRICWHLSQGCYPLRWSSVPTQPGTQNPTTLFPRAGWQGQGGGNRAGSDYRCTKITLLNHIRHSSRRHKGPEKRWHYDRPPWPLLDLSRPWGLSGNSWLASPTVAPWEAGCRNHAMCFWLCRDHLVLNTTCPQEPLPNLQQSSSLCHHHRRAQHQHRIPFTYRCSISSRLSKSIKQKQICVYVCSSI